MRNKPELYHVYHIMNDLFDGTIKPITYYTYTKNSLRRSNTPEGEVLQYPYSDDDLKRSVNEVHDDGCGKTIVEWKRIHL